jgi:phosphofructokinase-like protein
MVERLGILTGGGDCPGLNALIRAAVRYAINGHGIECVGILHGWRGLLDCVTMPLDIEATAGLLPRGGTILRTSRTNPYHLDDGANRVVANVKRLKLDGLIAIGGDDELGVAQRLFDESRVKVIGIPKTIDNDVPGTEYSFGFDSAVNIAMEAIDRIHTTAESHDRVMIVEVMGRLTGWIAACAGMAGGADFILIPERPVTVHQVCDAILSRHDRGKDFSIVVVAEGALISEGKDKQPLRIAQDETPDEFGVVRLGGVGNRLAKEIEKHTGFQTRVTVLGHLQRGGPPSAYDRVLGTRFGVAAVDLFAQKKFGHMTALRNGQVVPVSFDVLKEGRRAVPDDLFRVAEHFFG